MPILHDNQNPIMCFIGKVISVDDESDGGKHQYQDQYDGSKHCHADG